MTVVKVLFILLHAAGFLGILATALIALRKPQRRLPAAALHSAYTALVSGLGLVAINAWGLDRDINVLKVGVKFAVLAVIIALLLRETKRSTPVKGAVLAIGALTLVNVAIAVVV